MSDKSKLLTGIIITILILGGLLYWFSLSKPSQAEIQAKADEEKIEPVNKNLLSNKTIDKLKSMVKNGDIPIKVDSLSAGKDNLFE